MNLNTISIVVLLFLLTCGCSEVNGDMGNNSTSIGTSEHTEDYKVSKIQIKSESLEKLMNIKIFIPQGYSETEQYPVLYLLHGAGGNEDSWTKDMGVDKEAAKLINENKISPLIIVMPDYDKSYGTNYSPRTYSKGGRDYGMYEDYIYKDLVQYIDTHYNTIKSREGRFIGGLSMGGFAALHIAFNHQDMYSKVGGHSPAMFLESTAQLNWLYSSEKMRKITDPIQIAEEKDVSKLDIYLDHGDRDMDHVIESVQLLHSILIEQGANVQYHNFQGEHNNKYWKGNMERYLAFYSGK